MNEIIIEQNIELEYSVSYDTHVYLFSDIVEFIVNIEESFLSFVGKQINFTVLFLGEFFRTYY